MATQPEIIRQFLAELARLNRLARFIEEAPVPTERVEQFAQAFLDVDMVPAQMAEHIFVYEFEAAILSLAADPEACQAAIDKIVAAECEALGLTWKPITSGGEL